MLYKSWEMCRWCIKAVVQQDWSSYQWCNISWTIRIFCFYEKLYTCDKRDRNWTHDWTPDRQRNEIKFWKKYANDLDEQTELFTVSELHAKISTLEEKGLSVYCLQFFEPEHSKVVDSQIWQVPYYQRNVYKYKKQLLLLPQFY